MTLMHQPSRNRTLVHLVNVSGHADTAYFKPVDMRDVTIEVRQEFRRARAIAADRELNLTRSGGYLRFTLPLLKAYELIVLD
jgi:hypothetical protein